MTKRLRIRPWSRNDVDAALQIFGDEQVARWLTPAVYHIKNRDDMTTLLESWIRESDGSGLPLGRWAIEYPQTGSVIGAVALLPLPLGGLTWRSAGKSLLHTGVRGTVQKRVTLSPTEPSAPARGKCSQWCAPEIAAASRQHAGWAWNGSAKPPSTTG
jgi:hypothetical protein